MNPLFGLKLNEVKPEAFISFRNPSHFPGKGPLEKPVYQIKGEPVKIDPSDKNNRNHTFSDSTRSYLDENTDQFVVLVDEYNSDANGKLTLPEENKNQRIQLGFNKETRENEAMEAVSVLDRIG